MKAAVVRSFDHPPRYEDFDLTAPGPDDIVVDVLAAGLHPRVKSGASGSHYADERVLPMIPGIDAVGRTADGKLVYCVVHDTPFGTMAAQVVADRRRCVPLSESADAATIAAAMNPAMSSWLALKLRTPLQPGQSVFILGATGNAGQMAIRIAKLLGAGRVVAAGRETARLAGSGADEIVSLVGDPAAVGQAIGRAAADVDVVLDYVWGQPAVDAMVAIVTARSDRSKSLDWIQIGSVAGATLSLPSAALRSTNLRIMGSGQGSVSTRAIVGELPRLAEEIGAGHIPVDALRIPLAEVEAAWNAPVPAGKRVVLVP